MNYFKVRKQYIHNVSRNPLLMKIWECCFSDTIFCLKQKNIKTMFKIFLLLKIKQICTKICMEPFLCIIVFLLYLLLFLSTVHLKNSLPPTPLFRFTGWRTQGTVRNFKSVIKYVITKKSGLGSLSNSLSFQGLSCWSECFRSY